MANGEVVLINKSKRPHVIVLDHAAFRSKRYGFTIGSMVVSDHSADGTVSRRSVRRAVPGSITLLPGASSEPLHAAVRHVRQVKVLTARGELSIEDAPESKEDSAKSKKEDSAKSKKEDAPKAKYETAEPKSESSEPVQSGQRGGMLRRQPVEIVKKGSEQ
jgi:hypothetical protein